MSYTLVRSHRLYVTSENRDPNDCTYQFRMEIPNNLVALEDPATQLMKVSLMNFTCDCLWFEINVTNNTFILTNNTTHVAHTIVIPQGNYTFQRLALTISQLYTDCICQWFQETNKLLFTFTVPHSLSFVGSSYDTLGFSIGDAGVTGLTIASTSPLRTRANNIMYIRLNDVISANDNINLDNFNSIHAKPSNILCSIPVNATPFSTIFYDNSVYGRDVGVYLSNPRLDYLNISITDKYGNYIDYLSDWDMQLLVEVFNTEDNALVDVVSMLTSIDATLNRLLLLKFI